MYKLGAHLSIAGGYEKALEKIVKIGGNCLQIFSSSPRGWNKIKLTDQQIKAFGEMKKKLAIDPIFFHASYLINLADQDRIGGFSKKALIAELNTAFLLGIEGSIVHLGSFKNTGRNVINHVSTEKYATLIQNIQEILNNTPHDTFFIIENAGNKKIGQSLDEISRIVKDLNSERVKVCLDTCHLFSAGYDLRTPEKLQQFLSEFDQKIGLDKLLVWHFNDSRDIFNSGHDRHENIGAGTIGKEEFKLILNHPQLKNLPFIIETPGFDKMGPDKKNLDILKNLTKL